MKNDTMPIDLSSLSVFLVGGAVRDTLLNHPVVERDYLVVGSTPEQMKRLGFTQVGKDFPVFLHPQTKEEYALARTERKKGKGYTGFECYAEPDVTIEQDLMRRDLTVNAMAQSHHGDIIDPYGGKEDLKAKVLRHVSPAFEEDPLRVLRVARFAARYTQYGFTVANETKALMEKIALSGELSALSAERIWKEFERAISEPNPEVFITLLHETKALTAIISAISTSVINIQEVTSALVRVAQLTKDADIRFAVFVNQLIDSTAPNDQESALNAILSQLKVPNAPKLLTQKTWQLHEQIVNLPSQSPRESLTFFEQADIYRKPELLDNIILATRGLNGDCLPSELVNSLKNTAHLLRDVVATEYVKQGVKGKAIKEAMDRERVKIIASQINAM
ncbi:hypothetical protein ACFSJY_16880 [Thalassotalea euphylliae]|uniref:hypothetical protein n=1 Tax=Thalassotalea euphylliae TaxID=1655234 RepID=UPI003631465D